MFYDWQKDRIAIMQPYFFPYIGYWQLIHAVDLYVVADNVHYIKHHWINRNRILGEKDQPHYLASKSVTPTAIATSARQNG